MENSLKKLLLARYKKLIIGIILIVSGIYCFQTVSEINNWKQTFNYYESSASVKDFNQQIKDSYEFEDEQQGKLFLYYDLNKEQSIYTDSYDDYKEYLLTIFKLEHDSGRLPYSAYDFYNEHFILLFSIAMIVGFSLFMYDLKTNFNTVLFSSKFSKKDIYWEKYKIVGGTLFITLLASKLISLGAYWLLIPTEYLNITFIQHLLSTLSGFVLLMAAFTLSSFIGLILGEVISAIITMIGLFFTFKPFISDIHYAKELILYGQNKQPTTLITDIVETILPVSQTSLRPVSILSLLIIVVLTLLLLFLGQFIFDNISLEESGHYLLVPKFKRPVQLLFITYTVIFFNLINIVSLFSPEAVLPLSSYVKAISLLISTFVASYVFSELILYKKWPKLLNKIMKRIV